MENEEQVVVVNEKDEVLGTMSREQSHRDGTPHRIAVTYVTNSKGQILIQVRMSERLDHSSAGHVDPGEEYLDAARRELSEELGITDVELQWLGNLVSEEKFPDENIHRVHAMGIFMCEAEPQKLNEEEVKDVYWADPKEVLKEMQENQSDLKYCNGFRTSLELFLNKNSK